MDSTTIDKDLVEEREELMVSHSENNSRPIIKKAHFLKPCVSSVEGSQGILRPVPSPELKASSLCVSLRGWRLPNKKFEFWAKKMAALHKPIWLKSGIFEAIEASTYKIYKNPSLILSLAQNWCPETNTFVFPWGEATITLEDVNVLLGFSVSGSSVFAPLESSEMKEAVEKLEKQKEESMRQVSWISSFVDTEMEHEAFLVLWLSKFVFPDKSCQSIVSHVFPIAVRLARGETIALAPAVLANLYNDLGQISALGSTKNVYLYSLFKLVQVWVWERFRSIRPEANVIPRNKPRIAQWSGLKQRFDDVGLILFDGNFDWRPYNTPLKNWNPPRFYLEDAKWARLDESLDGDNEFVSFARFVRVSKLVGIGLVEDYYPNRVAMQFGLAQDLPAGLVTNHSSNVTEQEAWDDYNRSLVGLNLYIPSRLVAASVTARYRDWWTKPVSEVRKEPTETFNVNSTVDHYDDSDDDIPLKVVPLSQVLQKLDDEKKKAEPLTNKRHKRAFEEDDSTETEDDDNITIAQRIKSRKKCGDTENTGGETSRLEVDNNVSGLPQKLADTEAVPETEQKSDVNKYSSNPSNGVAQRINSRKKCGDTEDTAGERSRLEVDNNVFVLPQKLASGDDTVAAPETEQKSDVNKNSSNPSNGVAQTPRIKSRKKCGDTEDTGGERSRLEVDNNVFVLPQKLASGNETVATLETEQKHDQIKNSANPSNGVAEKKEDDVSNVTDDKRLEQRKLAIEELASKMEARMLEVENTLAKIKKWKLRRIQKKTLVST